jgi:hypothetical protein
VLTEHLAEGLDRISTVGPAVFEAPRFPANAVSAVPRLGAAVTSIERPSVIVLDDVHLLRDRECL